MVFWGCGGGGGYFVRVCAWVLFVLFSVGVFVCLWRGDYWGGGGGGGDGSGFVSCISASSGSGMAQAIRFVEGGGCK